MRNTPIIDAGSPRTHSERPRFENMPPIAQPRAMTETEFQEFQQELAASPTSPTPSTPAGGWSAELLRDLVQAFAREYEAHESIHRKLGLSCDDFVLSRLQDELSPEGYQRALAMLKPPEKRIATP